MKCAKTVLLGVKNLSELFQAGQKVKDIHFIVFDRLGEEVFVTDDIMVGWDGKYKGKDMPSDVYVYHLTATMKDGTEVKRKGNIILSR